MRALIQRVTRASVALGPRVVGDIGPGLLVFLGVQRGDDEQRAHSMAERLLAYRVFADGEGRMNLDVRAAGGGVLLVSQFTLAADTTRGLRPGFASAAAPALAEILYGKVLQRLAAAHQPVASGVFGATMEVSLINDGPVTFLLET